MWVESRLVMRNVGGLGIRSFLGRFRRGVLFGLAEFVGYPRWLIRTRGGRRLPQIQSGGVLVGGQNYSRAAFSNYQPLERVRWLLLMLAGIPDNPKDSLLIVGPRFESEFIIAEGLGWRRRDIIGLDLLAYSPRVVIGDMHAMPFSNETFSHVSCGWTLSYSRKPNVAASELIRILVPGGYLAIGVEVVDRDSTTPKIPGILGAMSRVQSLEDFTRVFAQMRICSYVSSGAGGNAVVLMQKP